MQSRRARTGRCDRRYRPRRRNLWDRPQQKVSLGGHLPFTGAHIRTSKILVLGASGPTGRQVVEQGLALGHHITAFVRDPGSITVTSDRLRIVAGSVTQDDGTLVAAVRDQDAVISALGRGQSFKSEGLIAASMPNIVRALEQQGVRRLVFTSGYGVGETYRDAPFLARVFIRTLLRGVYRDKEVGERLLHQSDLEWTLVYPTGLTDGPRTDAYRVGVRLQLRGVPTVSRADVAHFLLSQVTDRSFVRQGVLVSS